MPRKKGTNKQGQDGSAEQPFDCSSFSPDICMYCARGDYSVGYGPRTLVRCTCCAVKAMHVECLASKTNQEVASVLSLVMAQDAVVMCSQECQQIHDRWNTRTGKKTAVKGDASEYTLEVVKYKPDDKASTSVIEAAIKIFRGSFSKLVMDNGLDLVEMVCQSYESPAPPPSDKPPVVIQWPPPSGSEESEDEEDDEDVMYSFGEFRVLALRKAGAIVTVATLRVFGPHFAEMPFIATREGYRREGNCRRLVKAVDAMLSELGVTYLVLPSVKSVLSMWVNKFGFIQLTPEEHDVLTECEIVDMDPDTTCLIKRRVGAGCPPPTNPPARLPAPQKRTDASRSRGRGRGRKLSRGGQGGRAPVRAKKGGVRARGGGTGSGSDSSSSSSDDDDDDDSGDDSDVSEFSGEKAQEDDSEAGSSSSESVDEDADEVVAVRPAAARKTLGAAGTGAGRGRPLPSATGTGGAANATSSAPGALRAVAQPQGRAGVAANKPRQFVAPVSKVAPATGPARGPSSVAGQGSMGTAVGGGGGGETDAAGNSALQGPTTSSAGQSDAGPSTSQHKAPAQTAPSKPPIPPRKRPAPPGVAPGSKRPRTAAGTKPQGKQQRLRNGVGQSQDRARQDSLRQAVRERRAAQQDAVLATTLAEVVSQALMGKEQLRQQLDRALAEKADLAAQLKQSQQLAQQLQDHVQSLQVQLSQFGVQPPAAPPGASTTHKPPTPLSLSRVQHPTLTPTQLMRSRHVAEGAAVLIAAAAMQASMPLPSFLSQLSAFTTQPGSVRTTAGSTTLLTPGTPAAIPTQPSAGTIPSTIPVGTHGVTCTPPDPTALVSPLDQPPLQANACVASITPPSSLNTHATQPQHTLNQVQGAAAGQTSPPPASQLAAAVPSQCQRSPVASCDQRSSFPAAPVAGDTHPPALTTRTPPSAGDTHMCADGDCPRDGDGGLWCDTLQPGEADRHCDAAGDGGGDVADMDVGDDDDVILDPAAPSQQQERHSGLHATPDGAPTPTSVQADDQLGAEAVVAVSAAGADLMMLCETDCEASGGAAADAGGRVEAQTELVSHVPAAAAAAAGSSTIPARDSESGRVTTAVGGTMACTEQQGCVAATAGVSSATMASPVPGADMGSQLNGAGGTVAHPTQHKHTDDKPGSEPDTATHSSGAATLARTGLDTRPADTAREVTREPAQVLTQAVATNVFAPAMGAMPDAQAADNTVRLPPCQHQHQDQQREPDSVGAADLAPVSNSLPTSAPCKADPTVALSHPLTRPPAPAPSPGPGIPTTATPATHLPAAPSAHAVTSPDFASPGTMAMFRSQVLDCQLLPRVLDTWLCSSTGSESCHTPGYASPAPPQSLAGLPGHMDLSSGSVTADVGAGAGALTASKVSKGETVMTHAKPFDNIAIHQPVSQAVRPVAAAAAAPPPPTAAAATTTTATTAGVPASTGSTPPPAPSTALHSAVIRQSPMKLVTAIFGVELHSPVVRPSASDTTTLKPARQIGRSSSSSSSDAVQPSLIKACVRPVCPGDGDDSSSGPGVASGDRPAALPGPSAPVSGHRQAEELPVFQISPGGLLINHTPGGIKSKAPDSPLGGHRLTASGDVAPGALGLFHGLGASSSGGVTMIDRGADCTPHKGLQPGDVMATAGVSTPRFAPSNGGNLAVQLISGLGRTPTRLSGRAVPASGAGPSSGAASGGKPRLPSSPIPDDGAGSIPAPAAPVSVPCADASAWVGLTAPVSGPATSGKALPGVLIDPHGSSAGDIEDCEPRAVHSGAAAGLLPRASGCFDAAEEEEALRVAAKFSWRPPLKRAV